jgi:hypothetical protein
MLAYNALITTGLQNDNPQASGFFGRPAGGGLEKL